MIDAHPMWTFVVVALAVASIEVIEFAICVVWDRISRRSRP